LLYSRTRLSGQPWDRIIIIHLGGVSTYPYYTFT